MSDGLGALQTKVEALAERFKRSKSPAEQRTVFESLLGLLCGSLVDSRRRRLLWKTFVASSIVCSTNVIGNYGLSRGLHLIEPIASWSPAPYILALARPWVAVGLLFMVAWFIARLALLSWADLSYALPVTSFSYAASACVGALLLHEKVNGQHWTGIALLSVGVALVAFTYPHTSDAPKGTE